jgi:hypothetical protein
MSAVPTSAAVPLFASPGQLCVPSRETHPLAESAIEELELITPQVSDSVSISDTILDGCSKGCREYWARDTRHFYSSRRFLQDTQALLRTYTVQPDLDWDRFDSWAVDSEGHLNNETFETQYQYIDLERAKWVNHYPLVGQALVLSNYTAPITNLLLPFISVLIVLLLKYARTGDLCVQDAKTALWETIGKRLLGALSAPTLPAKVYAAAITGMYFVNVYANARSCIRFRESFREIRQYLADSTILIDSARVECQKLIEASTRLKTYGPFVNQLEEGGRALDECRLLLSDTSVAWQGGKSGQEFTTFYRLLKEPALIATCAWARSLLAYTEVLTTLQVHLANGRLAACSFSKRNTAFSGLRHPAMLWSSSGEAVENAVDVAKSIVLTGPNASGKTTLVKAVMINALMCQQWGLGTFKKAKVLPVVGFHCYMNVPDSTARDSLFQAEARRCKEVLDILSTTPGSHLCLFDELYSGTNPVEAAGATAAYLSFVSENYPSSRFLLTTHLTSVCEELEECAVAVKMGGQSTSTSFTPSYRSSKGVSRERTGYLVLRDLGYPDGIIEKLNTFAAQEY